MKFLFHLEKMNSKLNISKSLKKLELDKMHWKNIQKHHGKIETRKKKHTISFQCKVRTYKFKKKYPSTATLQFILCTLFGILKRRQDV